MQDQPVSSAISLRNVVTVLGGFPALAGLDLEIPEGGVSLLRGPNGAGKSTVLRLCAGLVPLESGSVSVLGFDLADDVTAIRRRVGLLGHQSGLYDDLTVADNLLFWSRAARAPKIDLESIMARVGLASRLRDVRVGSLSAGQCRRTAMAVLVARRPRLWLLDEPHAGLDADGRDLLDDLVAEALEVGVTVVMASHDHDRALAIATQVVDLAGGINRQQLDRGDASAQSAAATPAGDSSNPDPDPAPDEPDDAPDEPDGGPDERAGEPVADTSAPALAGET